MTTITHIKQLPWIPLRAFAVRDETEAIQTANGRKSYLFKQTDQTWYLFVKLAPAVAGEG